MERGSVIDAQIELEEQIALETERCTDPIYFMNTYVIIKYKEKVVKPIYKWEYGTNKDNTNQESTT